ncbi:MAG: hypothetical protein HY561_09490 [Gemmatimonadetes bacterium]|nr:hypothetical protein [Gemmatimonadota bacterium]
MAYLRRVDGQTVLVVANLGARSLGGVRVSSEDAVLPAGRYAVRPIFGGARASTLRVENDRRLRDWSPVAVLQPREVYVLELSPTDGGARVREQQWVP